MACCSLLRSKRFQFTHPVRGATRLFPGLQPAVPVSIHAPREGCDSSCRIWPRGSLGVSIHAPREGCDLPIQKIDGMLVSVSIHAPREGCDVIDTATKVISIMFQFTHPVRGATVASFRLRSLSKVSIHAPREGCDLSVTQAFRMSMSFNSRTP